MMNEGAQTMNGTSRVHFYGGSDDITCIEVSGEPLQGDYPRGQEFDALGSDLKRQFRLVHLGRNDSDQAEVLGVKVTAVYDGLWSFAVGLDEEGAWMPPWPVEIVRGPKPYTVMTTIEVPAGTSLVWEGAGIDE